jgi:hypothetical protein
VASLAIDTLWYSDKGNQLIGKTTTVGAVSGVFSSGDYGIRDLAWDGAHIWAISLNGTIKKFDTHGAQLATYSSLLSSGWGLTYDGTYIWASNTDADKIYRLSFPGLGDFTPPDAPVLSCGTHPSEDLWYNESSPTFNWTEPSDPTGITGYSYWLDRSPLTEPDTTSEGTSTTVTIVDLADGTWYFHCRARDGSGNWGPPNHYRIKIDTQSPLAPIDIVVIPDGWTNMNLYQVTWSYPEDSSSIAGSYYKLGSPPTHETDGTFLHTSQLISPVPAEGENNIYVWLEDGAGNRDHTANSSSSLLYDATAPIHGTISVNGGAEITGSPIVSLNDLSASDELSGMGVGAQMRFSNNGTDWSPAESFQQNRLVWDLSLYGGSGDSGEKIVFVQYQDAAGNWSATHSDSIRLAESLTIATDSLPGGPAGFAYQETLTVTGGVPPFTWSLSNGQLPHNLILENEGRISGILEEPGTWFFEVKVTDSFSNIRFRTLSISIFAGSMRGDVNGDTKLDLLDLMHAVGYVLGREDLTYSQLWAADVTPDGSINIADLVAIANLIIGREPGAARIPTSSVNLSVTQRPGASENTVDVVFSLENTPPVSGIQMRLRFPPSAALVQPPLITERCSSLNLSHTEGTDDLVIILYPKGDEAIAPGSGPIIELILSGSDSPPNMSPSVIGEILVAGIDGRLLTVQSKFEAQSSEPVPVLRAYNYPNPFNPDTRITFTLRREGSMTIAMYDVLGRRVRTIMEGYLEEGVHTVTWEGRDDRGVALPSGVYYCRFEGQNLSQTIPLTLIR